MGKLKLEINTTGARTFGGDLIFPNVLPPCFGLKRKKIFEAILVPSYHANPLEQPALFREAHNNVMQEGQRLEEGSISSANIFLHFLPEQKITRLDLLCEHLFNGAKYTAGAVRRGVYELVIASVPEFPNIYIASAALPMKEETYQRVVESRPGEICDDLSLDVVPVYNPESDKDVFGMRIPLLRDDQRVPAEHRGKYGHIFSVRYTVRHTNEGSKMPSRDNTHLNIDNTHLNIDNTNLNIDNTNLKYTNYLEYIDSFGSLEALEEGARKALEELPQELSPKA